MKIGIFGGSFNPPHNMHLNIALELIEKEYLNEIIYVPTGDKYNKNGLISCKHRINMVKLMIEKYNKLSLTDIGNKDLYQYTYQVLDYFKSIKTNSNIYFICGTDNLKELDTWRNYEYILENYKLLVIRRNNDNIDEILKKYEKYRNNIIIANIESKVLSSTDIRINLRENKREENLSIDVYNYIKENNLYKEV